MATAHGNPRLRSFLVECYAPGIGRDAVALSGGNARAAADALRRDGRAIDYVRALLVPGDEVVFHLFIASDSRLVRRAMANASLKYERIVESIVVEDVPALQAAASE